MTRVRADILLGLTALVWGAAFVGQATAMEHLGPFSFTGIRFLLATHFGMLLLGERLDTWGLIGCVSIPTAVLLVQLAPYWRSTRA